MLDDLYRQVVLAHYQSPRHRRDVPDATVSASAQNPLCGDELSIMARLEGDTIVEVGFQARGCAITHAVADMMAEAVEDGSVADAIRLHDAFSDMLVASGPADPDTLGELAALAGVTQFPSRVKCALLPWQTLRGALEAHAARRA